MPHDWAIDGPFDPKQNPHTGALPIFGTGWYRKSFTLPESAKGREFEVQFDGAMSNATVWLNGHELGAPAVRLHQLRFRPDAVSQFRSQPNVLAVRLDARRPLFALVSRAPASIATSGSSRPEPVHVAHWGTYVTTPDITDEKAAVSVKTEVANQSGQEAKITLETSVVDAAGRTVAKTTSDATVAAGGSQTVDSSLTVPRPERWDIDRPYLYTVVSQVREGKRVVDRYTTPLGIRTVVFDAQKGFLLNGRHVKIQGVCDHHDLGALGAAVNRRATERQLQILRGAGVNAIRTSHNPPSPELLELCDRMGFVVMDESFDMWRIPKVPERLCQVFRRMERARRARLRAPRPQPSERDHVEHRQRDSGAGEAARVERWPSA